MRTSVGLAGPADDVDAGAAVAAPVRRPGLGTRLALDWWQFAIVLAFAAAGPFLFANSPYFNLFTLAGIWGVASVGVSLLAGLGGQFTFGQAGIVSIGAYASAIVVTKHDGPALVGIAVGVAVAVAVALVTAPILRLRGWYLALATMAMGYLFHNLAINLKSLTGGNDGIIGIPPLRVFGFEARDKADFFIVSWVLVLGLMILARNLARGRFGRAARAMQADEEAALGLGVPAFRYKTAIYVLAAAMAALSGSLYVHYGRYISPEDFGIRQSVLLFTAMLLGGYRSVFGGLAALVFLVSLPELGRDFAETQLLTALALMIVYAISTDGLAGIGKAIVGRLGIGGSSARDR